MSDEPSWRDITSAPRDGTLILLCVPDGRKVRPLSKPDDRHVHGLHGVIGKLLNTSEKHEARWISDLRCIEHGESGSSYSWVHEPLAPTHWMPLPPPPPSPGWHDGLKELPPLKSFAIIHDEKVRLLREDPAMTAVTEDPAATMVMGCLVDAQPDFLPLWATDLFEESGCPENSEDIGELYADQIDIPAAFWFDLPPPPIG